MTEITFEMRAAELLKRGFSIIPIKACDKAPVAGFGVTHRSKDPDVVHGWAVANPDANVGVVADGEIVILDADDAVALQAATGRLNTYTVQSSPGKAHYYFRRDGFPVRNLEMGKLGSLRASEMYVVGPGSIHPKTKQPYTIINDADVAVLQHGLYRELEILAKNAEREMAKVIVRWDGKTKFQEGERHYFLRSQAGKLWDGEKSDEELFAELKELNEKFCDPPKPDGAVMGLVTWVMTKEAHRPGPMVNVGAGGEVTYLQGPDGINLTEMGNAERVLLAHRENILWVAGANGNSAGVFYTWTGQRWEEDTSAKVPGLVKLTMRGLGRLVKAAVDKQADSKFIEKLVGFWRQSEQDYMIRDVTRLLRSDVAVSRDRFDANSMLFNVQNGCVDLTTGEFREADRSDYMTKMSNATFDKAAECPLWERFLSDTVRDDVEMMRYLQQCAGICLSGETGHHLFFIVLGPGGTGKTTFQEALKYVWGDYCTGVDPNSLAAGKVESARARPDLAKLPGVRLAFANESRAGLRLDEGLLKSLVGGDTVTARQLYQAEFDFIPQYKLWLRTNERPVFDGADTGMQRRVRLIMFDHIVEAKDAELPRKLRGEASGILNWALAGLKDYQQNGLKEPEAVLKASRDYTDSLDIVKQFLLDCCELRRDLV